MPFPVRSHMQWKYFSIPAQSNMTSSSSVPAGLEAWNANVVVICTSKNVDKNFTQDKGRFPRPLISKSAKIDGYELDAG